MGSSQEDLRAMPSEVRAELGFSLDEVQCGRHPASAKRLKGELRGLLELVHRSRDAYRLIYAVRFADAIWVIHVFNKKSTHGIGIPRHELRTILARWRALQARYVGTHLEGGHDATP